MSGAANQNVLYKMSCWCHMMNKDNKTVLYSTAESTLQHADDSIVFLVNNTKKKYEQMWY